MSNERVTAISFMINGRQAEQTLERLTSRAEELREAIDAAQSSGDAQKVQRLNRELQGVNREIAIINRNVRSVENALEYLRGVTKEEVKDGMDYWKEQADGLKIGSEAWERAFGSYLGYKADYEKILALERNPLELLLHYEMEWRDQQKQIAQADYEQGLLTYREYKRKMLEIDRDYYDMARTNSWISNHDAQEFARQLDILNGKLAQMDQADERRETRDQWNERIAQIKEEYRIQQETLTTSYENQEITRRAFEEQKFRNEIDYLYRLKEAYRENSYDRHRIENEIQRKDTKTMERAASSYAKHNRIDLEDEQAVPYDMIVPQPFTATDDPRVLGIKPIPNIQEKISAMIQKYRAETIDIEDVTFEEVNLEFDTLYPNSDVNSDNDDLPL